ncbi:MAG: SAP domain-containing protein [Proteobacteria bacterium]|nr:SAP domain-containing protein [Pseudomonadota bacterium]MBU1715414.1 SAP domain-containing protein [Pseudomonadota bacterium]
MKMVEVKEKAKKLGVKSGKMKKEDLIRAIQIAEGNDACFGSNNKQCPQMDCCWRDECITD